MIRVLLLDCSYALEQRLKRQGFDVDSGTIGFATGTRTLPSQVYEKDIFIYNPVSQSLVDGRIFTAIEIKDNTPQFSLEYLEKRIQEGGTFLVFVNRIAQSLQAHEIMYGWIPFMPPIEFTHDTVVHANPFDAYPDWDWKLLAPIVEKDQVDLPVLQRLKPPKAQEYRKDIFWLFVNNNNNFLGVLILRGNGRLIILPKCKSNDDVIERFLQNALPKLYNTTSRTGLMDTFTSPAEWKRQETLKKLEALSAQINERQTTARIELETARRTKSAVISGDATAKQILIYYDQAKRQDDAALFYLYKIIDAIENKHGGEVLGIQAVGAGAEWKAVKRLANESYRDARHAPKPTDIIKKWSNAEIKKCFEDTEKVVMAYFTTLFKEE